MSNTNITNFQQKIQELKTYISANSASKIKAVQPALEGFINTLEKEFNTAVTNYETQIAKLPDLQKMNDDFKKKVIAIENNASQKIIDKIDELDKKKKEELEEARKYAIEKSISSAIDVIDQLEIALGFAVKDPAIKNYVSGFKMVLDMFLKWLKEFDIHQIPIKVGDGFDEKKMSAFEKNPSDLPKNHVVRVMRSGYTLHDRVLRHAAVSVSDGSLNKAATQQVKTVAINPNTVINHPAAQPHLQPVHQQQPNSQVTQQLRVHPTQQVPTQQIVHQTIPVQHPQANTRPVTQQVPTQQVHPVPSQDPTKKVQ